MTKRITRITPTKHYNVSVPGRNRYLGYGSAIGTYTPTNDALVGTYVTYDWGRTWAKRVEVDVYLDRLSIEDAIAQLREKADGLTDALVNLDCDDSSYPQSQVVGQREATEAEIAEVLRFIEFDKAARAKQEITQRNRLIAEAKRLGLKPEDLS